MITSSLVDSPPLSLHHATMQDVLDIYDNLRPNDIKECEIFGFTPLDALSHVFEIEGHYTYALKKDNVCIAMCGTVPLEEGRGSVWMLGTEGINTYAKPFVRKCKEVITLLQGDYDIIENICPVGHDETIMWLSWCGFVFHEQREDVNGYEMLRFVRCKDEKSQAYYTQRPVYH
jgi:hypothetical protein